MRRIILIHLALVLVGCKANTSAKTASASALSTESSSVDRLAVFHNSPQEELKPTIWDTGDTTVTNEDRLEIFKPSIENIGGGYVGVGSIQNFTLAAWAKSEYIWLMDFTRIVVATNKIHVAFLKQCDTPERHRELWDKKKSAKAADAIIEAEFAQSPDLAFIKESYRKASPYLMITFRFLDKLTAKRNYKTWLHDKEQYLYLKKLALENKIRPVRGNLNGDITVAGIADAARKMGVPMRILYYSNAEEYFKEYSKNFKDSFGKMPVDENSMVLRTISFEKNKFRWAEDSHLSTDRGFHYSVHKAQDFLEALKAEHIRLKDFYAAARIDSNEPGLTYLGSIAHKK